jgi:hypothetical protein
MNLSTIEGSFSRSGGLKKQEYPAAGWQALADPSARQ